MDAKNFIAARVAKELKDGDVVNLGIGLPTLVANYVPENVHITLQAEHGILGAGPAAKPGEEDSEICNAGGFPITVMPGASFFDSATSFAIIRGGHVDVTVLGALRLTRREISPTGWCREARPGMGGAMDLVVGAKSHCGDGACHKGSAQILKIAHTDGRRRRQRSSLRWASWTLEGIVLRDCPGLTVDDVQAVTGAKLVVSGALKVMESECKKTQN